MMITNETMAAVRAIAVTFEGLILIVTLWKLKRAKVKRTDSGHLKSRNAAYLLILQFFEVFCCIMYTFVFSMSKKNW